MTIDWQSKCVKWICLWCWYTVTYQSGKLSYVSKLYLAQVVLISSNAWDAEWRTSDHLDGEEVWEESVGEEEVAEAAVLECSTTGCSSSCTSLWRFRFKGIDRRGVIIFTGALISNKKRTSTEKQKVRQRGSTERRGETISEWKWELRDGKYTKWVRN